MTAIILALGVSADALACGFGAGTSGIRVPLRSAFAAGVVSALLLAAGLAAGRASAPLLPPQVWKYMSFGILAILGGLKLCGDGSFPRGTDCNADRVLSVLEGAALGGALSVDGLAAGFGMASSPSAAVLACVAACIVSALSLYFGAKSGRGVRSPRLGNIAAGLALILLAVEKLF